MTTATATPRHVLNALNKQGTKIDDLDDAQRARAGQASTVKAGLRGKALAAWILTGQDAGEQIAAARSAKAQPTQPPSAPVVEDTVPARGDTYGVTASGALERQDPAPRRPTTGPELMRAVLNAAACPLHIKVLAERVLANGGDAMYTGKTPTQTMSGQLGTSHNRGGVFVKVAPGCFALRDWPQDQRDRDPIRPAKPESA